jgi:hypothetical protein
MASTVSALKTKPVNPIVIPTSTFILGLAAADYEIESKVPQGAWFQRVVRG